MKKIIIMALALAGFAELRAQTPGTKETPESTPAVKTMDSNDKAPASDPVAPADAVKTSPEKSSNYVGTNELNLHILREGIKRA